GDLLDAYFWLDRPECQSLAEPVREIRKAGEAAIGEFDKVQKLRSIATERTTAVKEAVGKLVRETRTSPPDALQGFVHQLAGLRKLRGEVIALRDVRYTEEETVASLEKEVIEATDAVSARTVDFLLGENSLKSYAAAIEA